MVRKLKYHEATLLRKLDFINWKSDASQRENAIIRRYHIQDREDYHTYNKVCGLITKLTTQLKNLDQRDPVRIEITDLLVEKLYSLGLIQKKRLLACDKIAASTLCRRRLPVVLVRLRFAEQLKEAVGLIEQGHIRVGPHAVTDPAYLVSRGELSGSAAGTAVLNIAISGTSFLLTLAWLGLQVADSARRHAMSGKTHSGKSRWPGMGTVKNLNPFSSRSHRKGMAVSGNDPGITITHGAPGQGSTVASCEDLVVTGEVTTVTEADQVKTDESGKVDTEPSLAADEAPYIGVGTSRRRISMLPSFTEKQVTTKL